MTDMQQLHTSSLATWVARLTQGSAFLKYANPVESSSSSWGLTSLSSYAILFGFLAIKNNIVTLDVSIGHAYAASDSSLCRFSFLVNFLWHNFCCTPQNFSIPHEYYPSLYLKRRPCKRHLFCLIFKVKDQEQSPAILVALDQELPSKFSWVHL